MCGRAGGIGIVNWQKKNIIMFYKYVLEKALETER